MQKTIIVGTLGLCGLLVFTGCNLFGGGKSVVNATQSAVNSGSPSGALQNASETATKQSEEEKAIADALKMCEVNYEDGRLIKTSFDGYILGCSDNDPKVKSDFMAEKFEEFFENYVKPDYEDTQKLIFERARNAHESSMEYLHPFKSSPAMKAVIKSSKGKGIQKKFAFGWTPSEGNMRQCIEDRISVYPAYKSRDEAYSAKYKKTCADTFMQGLEKKLEATKNPATLDDAQAHLVYAYYYAAAHAGDASKLKVLEDARDTFSRKAVSVGVEEAQKIVAETDPEPASKEKIEKYFQAADRLFNASLYAADKKELAALYDEITQNKFNKTVKDIQDQRLRVIAKLYPPPTFDAAAKTATAMAKNSSRDPGKTTVKCKKDTLRLIPLDGNDIYSLDPENIKYQWAMTCHVCKPNVYGVKSCADEGFAL